MHNILKILGCVNIIVDDKTYIGFPVSVLTIGGEAEYSLISKAGNRLKLISTDLEFVVATQFGHFEFSHGKFTLNPLASLAQCPSYAMTFLAEQTDAWSVLMRTGKYQGVKIDDLTVTDAQDQSTVVCADKICAQAVAIYIGSHYD